MTMPSLGRAWITGAGGFIASYLVREAARAATGMEIIGLRRPEFDLGDLHSIDRRFAGDRPDLILHCAALSRMNECQANPALAHQLNVAATRHLADLAAEIPLLFLSSDLVFDGTRGWYQEEDSVNPLSVYAESKAAAEQMVLRHRRHFVVRLSLTAGVSTGGRAFNEVTRRAWQEGRETPLFIDEFRCPLAAAVAAQAIWELVQRGQPGLYHLGGSERLSRLEIGHVLARRWAGQPAPQIRATSLRDYTGPRRPADTSMNCARVQSVLSFPLPAFSRWVDEHPEEPL
jgi:dTDP-4-dehydrorhamnose reductase